MTALDRPANELFTEFFRIEDEPDYVGPDWSKDSLAVLASDGDDGWVLFHVGAHLEQDISDVGSRRLEDLGLTCPASVWIWKGRMCSSTTYWGEVETWLEGDTRAPTDEEWAAIRAGDCPWNPDDWLLKPETIDQHSVEIQ